MPIFRTPNRQPYISTERLEAAAADVNGSSSAAVLALVPTGAELSDKTIAAVTDMLADLAVRYGLSPDETQLVLAHHEPILDITL